MDAAFTSIGLNYFTAVVPKVEEFNERFVENGRIKNLKGLAEADMDYACRLLARFGHYVVTSLYCYYSKGKTIHRRERSDPYRAIFMRESLRHMIQNEAHTVILIYSVPGAHYIETEWCYERSKIDPEFECYGITFVRKVDDGDNNCKTLKTKVFGLDCSECTAGPIRTAWDCIEGRKIVYRKKKVRIEEFCPFKEQGVAKNVLEYFFRSPKMRLFALERLDILGPLLFRLIQ